MLLMTEFGAIRERMQLPPALPGREFELAEPDVPPAH
jgi:hypothetical protein